MIYYFVNYEKEITAIGECNPPYMKDKGYTLVDKEEYNKKNEEYTRKYANDDIEDTDDVLISVQLNDGHFEE